MSSHVKCSQSVADFLAEFSTLSEEDLLSPRYDDHVG